MSSAHTACRPRVDQLHICAYRGPVGFEWDERKAKTNLRKHRIDFADAVGVLEDPLGVTIPDENTDEERFVTVGSDFLGRILVVVYTVRGHHVRLISARKATRQERRRYEGDS